MKWYIKAIKNYVNFSGRARRKEYWMFFLFNLIFGIVAGIIDNLFDLNLTMPGGNLGYGIVGLIYSIFVILPGLGVEVRRLHDINKSGGWIFIGLIPIVGAIVLFIFSVSDGTNGANRYGENPKENELI